MQLAMSNGSSVKVGCWSAVVVETQGRNQLVDITPLLSDIVKRSGVLEGSCHLFVPSRGAAIVSTLKPIAALDSLQAVEFVMAVEEMVERSRQLDPRHMESWMPIDPRERASISETVPIQNGKLALRFGFTICLCEYEGPRELEILVKIERD